MLETSISHDVEKPFLIAGLEVWLKRALGVGGIYGVLDDGQGGGLFYHGSLWERGEDKESLTRILFPLDRNTRVPS